MFNYNLILRKFKKCCAKDSVNVQELYDSIMKIMPDKYKVDFAMDVLKFKPLVVDVSKLNKEVVENHDIANCVRLLEQSWLIGRYFDKGLEAIAYYGSAEDCYRVIMCFDLKSDCKKLKSVTTDNERGLKMMSCIYLMDTKVLASKNAKYNFDIANMVCNGDLAKCINQNNHIDAVIDSENGEYMSRLLSEGNRFDLDNEKINEIVDILCDKKYSSQNKCKALISLGKLEGNQYNNYAKLYQSIVEKGNPMYIYALRKSYEYSKKYDEARAYLTSKEKDYTDMDLVSEREDTFAR